MQNRRPLGKNERRPVIDSGNVVARGGSGSVIMRGSSGTAIRRGGRSGLRFIVFLAIVGGLYWAAGTYRHEIIARFPAAFPVLKAIGFDVSEPAGYGLRAEVLRTDRQSEGMNQAYLLINGMIENQRSTRTTIMPLI